MKKIKISFQKKLAGVRAAGNHIRYIVHIKKHFSNATHFLFLLTNYLH